MKTYRRREFLRFLDRLGSYEAINVNLTFVLRTADAAYSVVIPFPAKPGETLDEYLKRQTRVGVILLRAGNYAAGVFDGHNLVVHKIGKGLVHAKVKAGGQSASRYQRTREEQLSRFLQKVCGAVTTTFSQHDLDHIFFAADRITMERFIESCEYLKDQRDKINERILKLRHATNESLRNSYEEIWQFKVS